MSDLISRQDAIDALGDEPEVWNDTDAEWAERDAWVMHKVAIEALPSADRPTGEWVRKYDKQINCYWYECNQCGEYRPRNMFGKEWSSPYCPNCGAKLV